jgi:hypothetical protein
MPFRVQGTGRKTEGQKAKDWRPETGGKRNCNSKF